MELNGAGGGLSEQLTTHLSIHPKIVYNGGMADDPKIVFQAEVVKVMTMADGSPRITFGAGEKSIRQAAMLMECQAGGIYLEITCKEVPKTEVKGLDRGL